MRKIIWVVSAVAACAGNPKSASSPPEHEHEQGHAHAHGGAPMDSSQPAMLFGNLGAHRRKITTSSPDAQKYFDQGLALLFGFNHDEAIRSFTEATRLDPSCAMCFWGLAYAHGPHINNPVLEPAHAKAAWEAIERARAHKPHATEVERAFIDSLAKRYAANPTADRAPLDKAYADAMRAVWKRYPDDTDAGTLFAEAMMDLRPWDLWKPDGKPQPGTEEIVATLEAVMAKDPSHPGANHFYIHALEASPNPEKAMAAADRVGGLVPGAGHLVHMPAHVFIRVGRYKDAAATNRRAIEVDREYRARAGKQGFYEMYIAHNFQFLWAADIWAGRHAEARQAQRDMVASFSPEMAAAMPEIMDLIEPYPLLTAIRFGKWDEVLTAPEPLATRPLSQALWHFARGVAFVQKSRLGEAEIELAILQKTVPALPNTSVMVFNPPRTLGTIGLEQLAGEIAVKRGRIDQAVKHMRAAIAVEDNLRYNEPPDWVLPVRHALGAVLLDAGRVNEAEGVYREDLQRNPENGWSLMGLSKCLRARNAPASEIAEVDKRFKAAWSVADVTISSSRF